MKDLGSEEIINEEKRYHLKASMFLLGGDLVIIISGIQDHVGSITLAQPYNASLNPNINAKNTDKLNKKRISSSISTLTQYHHRDDQLLAEFARNLSQQLNLVVTVIGGIHVDNITADDIKTLSEMIHQLQKKIIVKMSHEV